MKEITVPELAEQLNLSWFDPKVEKDVEQVKSLIEIVAEMTPIALLQEVFSNFLQGRYWR